MDPLWLVLPGLCIWLTVLALPWRPWSTRESLDATTTDTATDLGDVTILIPARNEARHIISTLNSLSGQGRRHRIILIDDESSDATAALAASLNLSSLEIIKGRPLAPGWSGKLWALEQGRLLATSKYLLLLDADICLTPGLLPALLDKRQQEGLHFVSLMASLRMESGWEKMLMPAFIYFFKLLYPFSLSNSTSRLVAAAAGGCILIDRQVLEDIGGFSAVQGQLIDDCALARQVKKHGCKTWIGLTHSVLSQRCYDDLQTVWDMVARTAFTQLRYSSLLLGVCTLLMLSAFVLPLAGLLSGQSTVFTLACLAILIMISTYLPTLKYYRLNLLWACTLPLTGLLYLGMTWGSAINHWSGKGASWKGRSYHSPSPE